MKTRTEYNCPLELTHDIIRGKWKPMILWQLHKHTHSLSELRKSIQGVSQKMLLQHLHELISCGLVQKKSFEGYPLHVEYSLTSRGHKIYEAVIIMQSVGIEMMIEDDREEFLKEKGLI